MSKDSNSKGTSSRATTPQGDAVIEVPPDLPTNDQPASLNDTDIHMQTLVNTSAIIPTQPAWKDPNFPDRTRCPVPSRRLGSFESLNGDINPLGISGPTLQDYNDTVFALREILRASLNKEGSYWYDKIEQDKILSRLSKAGSFMCNDTGA
jgi:hypothetical protein